MYKTSLSPNQKISRRQILWPTIGSILTQGCVTRKTRASQLTAFSWDRNLSLEPLRPFLSCLTVTVQGIYCPKNHPSQWWLPVLSSVIRQRRACCPESPESHYSELLTMTQRALTTGYTLFFFPSGKLFIKMSFKYRIRLICHQHKWLPMRSNLKDPQASLEHRFAAITYHITMKGLLHWALALLCGIWLSQQKRACAISYKSMVNIHKRC